MASTDNLFFAEWKIIYENLSHQNYNTLRIMYNSFLRLMLFIASSKIKIANNTVVPFPIYVKPTSHLNSSGTYATQLLSDGCISPSPNYDGTEIKRLSSQLHTNGELHILYPLNSSYYHTFTQVYYIWPDWILNLPDNV